MAQAPFFKRRVEAGLGKKGSVKRYLFEKDYSCSECGISQWQGKRLNLELDHINGVNTDNRLENVRLLCPNCHSQTPNVNSKNASPEGRKRILEALDRGRQKTNTELLGERRRWRDVAVCKTVG